MRASDSRPSAKTTRMRPAPADMQAGENRAAIDHDDAAADGAADTRRFPAHRRSRTRDGALHRVIDLGGHRWRGCSASARATASSMCCCVSEVTGAGRRWLEVEQRKQHRAEEQLALIGAVEIAPLSLRTRFDRLFRTVLRSGFPIEEKCCKATRVSWRRSRRNGPHCRRARSKPCSATHDPNV